MAEISAFQAVTYNQEKIKDLSKVVCPPYDVISPLQQQNYHELSPYNFIHILLGKDIPGEDKYKRAEKHFLDWQKEGVLVQDKLPAIYFYLQEYNLKGEKRRRLGLVALLRIEDKNSPVFGHERTRQEPKEDRLKLLRQVKANLSPIFVVFQDKKRVIRNLWDDFIQKKDPFISITDPEGVVHTVWRIDDPKMLEGMKNKISQENIFIADGHHRYEVSGLYREEMKKKLGTLTGAESFNYVLAYFTTPQLPDLTILPIHRLVKLPQDFSWDKFIAALEENFVIEEFKDKNRFFFLMQKAGNTEHVIGLYKDNRFWLLRLKNIKILDRLIAEKTKEYRQLDVSIFNFLVLKKSLGLDIEDKVNIQYNHDAEELIELVKNNPRSVAFFLNSPKLEQVISIALAGDKMPSKSTFFYPKVLSGLFVHKFK